jgi:outer membrane protein TolC
MVHDREYFRRRAAEARSAAFHKDDVESVEVAGQLALAYAALARLRGAPPKLDAPDAVDAIEASVADPVPLILRD